MLLISPVFKDEKKWDVKKQKNEPAPKGGQSGILTTAPIKVTLTQWPYSDSLKGALLHSNLTEISEVRFDQ